MSVRSETQAIRLLGTLLAPALAPIAGLLVGVGSGLSVLIIFFGFFADPLHDSNRFRYLAASLQVQQISKALDQYKADCGDFPSVSKGLTDLVVNPGNERWRGPYLKRLPVDPWDQPYLYSRPLASAVPEVLSFGANRKPGGELFDTDISSLRPRQPIPESQIETRSRYISFIIWIGAWAYLINSVVVLTRISRRDSSR